LEYPSQRLGYCLRQRAIYPFTSSATLYAQWGTGTVTVTFNANSGQGTMANETEATGVATQLTANAFSRAGFIFAGWNTQANGSGTAFVDLAIYPFTASATLYAQWTNDHTLESLLADPNPANLSVVTPGEKISVVYMDDSPIDGNGKYALPTVVLNGQFLPVTITPTSGYPVGNYIDPQFGGSEKNTYEDLLTFTLPATLGAGTNVLTITAYDGDGDYDQATFNVQTQTDTLTFVSDGGAAVSPISGNYNTTVALPLDTQTGYSFVGWFTSASGGTQVTSPDTLSANATLYAQWTINTETVTFVSDGGAAVAPISGNYNTSVALPLDTQTGYSFVGWFTSAVGGTQVTSPDTLTTSSTLYAQWTIQHRDRHLRQ